MGPVPANMHHSVSSKTSLFRWVLEPEVEGHVLMRRCNVQVVVKPVNVLFPAPCRFRSKDYVSVFDYRDDNVIFPVPVYYHHFPWGLSPAVDHVVTDSFGQFVEPAFVYTGIKQDYRIVLDSCFHQGIQFFRSPGPDVPSFLKDFGLQFFRGHILYPVPFGPERVKHKGKGFKEVQVTCSNILFSGRVVEVDNGYSFLLFRTVPEVCVGFCLPQHAVYPVRDRVTEVVVLGKLGFYGDRADHSVNLGLVKFPGYCSPTHPVGVFIPFFIGLVREAHRFKHGHVALVEHFIVISSCEKEEADNRINFHCFV